MSRRCEADQPSLSVCVFKQPVVSNAAAITAAAAARRMIFLFMVFIPFCVEFCDNRIMKK